MKELHKYVAARYERAYHLPEPYRYVGETEDMYFWSSNPPEMVNGQVMFRGTTCGSPKRRIQEGCIVTGPSGIVGD